MIHEETQKGQAAANGSRRRTGNEVATCYENLVRNGSFAFPHVFRDTVSATHPGYVSACIPTSVSNVVLSLTVKI